MPPELIAGRYRVEREVGRGGMGSVWLCRDERLGRPVAVKQVGGLPGESSMHIARALREARHSAALNHPNVVSIFDALEEGDHVWLVMEYVPSRTLSQLIKQDGAVEPTRAAWIGAQVADGLAAAHARGTIHRDVKPGNILVRDDDLAKISDFGIARTLGEEQLTRSGLVTGTPVYFSPELARGEEASPASDVWAMGASLYAAVEGRPPYPDQTNAIALLSTIARERPQRPQRAGVLEQPIARMLDPDPTARWTMAQVAHALHRIHEDATGMDASERTTVLPAPVAEAPRPEPPPTPVRETVHVSEPATAERAAGAGVAAAAAAGGPPAGGGASPGHPGDYSRDYSDDHSDEYADDGERRRGPALAAILGVVVLLMMVGLGYWLLRDTEDPGPTAQDDRTPAATKSSSPEQSSPASPTSSPTSSDDGEATSTPESTPTTETTAPPTSPATTEAVGGSPASSRAAFAQNYYTLLPEDRDTAWSMLAPGVTSRDTFYGFWATIDSVEVNGTRAAGPNLVEVDITYVSANGSEPETRLLEVSKTGDGYLITRDLGAV